MLLLLNATKNISTQTDDSLFKYNSVISLIRHCERLLFYTNRTRESNTDASKNFQTSKYPPLPKICRIPGEICLMDHAEERRFYGLPPLKNATEQVDISINPTELHDIFDAVLSVLNRNILTRKEVEDFLTGCRSFSTTSLYENKECRYFIEEIKLFVQTISETSYPDGKKNLHVNIPAENFGNKARNMANFINHQKSSTRSQNVKNLRTKNEPIKNNFPPPNQDVNSINSCKQLIVRLQRMELELPETCLRNKRKLETVDKSDVQSQSVRKSPRIVKPVVERLQNFRILETVDKSDVQKQSARKYSKRVKPLVEPLQNFGKNETVDKTDVHSESVRKSPRKVKPVVERLQNFRILETVDKNDVQKQSARKYSKRVKPVVEPSKIPKPIKSVKRKANTKSMTETDSEDHTSEVKRKKKSQKDLKSKIKKTTQTKAKSSHVVDTKMSSKKYLRKSESCICKTAKGTSFIQALRYQIPLNKIKLSDNYKPSLGFISLQHRKRRIYSPTRWLQESGDSVWFDE